MLKSISNIAWPQNDEQWVLKKLQEYHWNAVEIAPSKIWEDFRKISKKERMIYREKIESNNLRICAIHSLFWGVHNANIFGERSEQENFKDYMKLLVDLATDLGSKRLILGSPAVRDRRNYEYKSAMYIAADVLREPVEYAGNSKIKILIEPLTKKETNFINTHREGMELVKLINNEGLGLHLDAKSIASEDMMIRDIILECGNDIEHFHINDPELQEIGVFADYHNTMGNGLQEITYKNFVSIEMKMQKNHRESIERSINFVNLYY